MPEFPAQVLARWTGGRWTTEPRAPLTAFHYDTRQLQRGDIFVALKTEKRDGHEFLADAQEAGAGAAIVATPNKALTLPQLVVPNPLAAFQQIAREHRRTFRGAVIAISGSAGKTSTKDLLALLLGGASCGVVATEGNLNNHIGVPLTLTRLDPARDKFAVVEVGINAPGEMKPLADMVEPDVSLITLVAPAHTAALGGLEGVAREKALLPAALRATGLAIFTKPTADQTPFRELGVRKMILEHAVAIRPADAPKDRIYYAVSHRAERTAVSLAYGPPPPMLFVMRRVSDGMAENAGLAICAALWLGIPRETIQSRLAGWKPGKLRGEVRYDEGRMLYLDCYNANPASMADALATFGSIAPVDEPRLFLLGCMEELGADAAVYHRALGRSLRLDESDRMIIIGTHANDVCAGLLETGDYSRQIQIAGSLEPMSAAYKSWRGSVFIKGSRRYELEKILEVQTSLPLTT